MEEAIEFPVYEGDQLFGTARSWWGQAGEAMVEFTPPLPAGYQFKISVELGSGKTWFEIWRDD